MLFRAEDTSRANYRSLFEYAVGDEARLAQDRRLAYYEQVLPEMLARVKGLPLMYQTYSKRWSPEDNRPQFIVKRLVPNEDGDKIDIVMESDQDIADFMARKGRFKGQHGFNKGFSYLAPIYHVERDEMPFIQVDLDIDQADFGKQAWSRLLEAVEQVYNWFRENGYDALINFTGSSFHVWAKDGQVRTYAETKQVLEALSEATGLPLSAGAAHVAGQITIDYPQNKYRAPLRFPLSIHGDTGLVSIIIPRNQLRRFDPLKRAHPEEVLKRLPKELERIDAWFSDLSTTTTKQAEETFSAESRKVKELKNRIRIQLAKLDEPLPDSTNHGTPRRLFYEAIRDSYGKGFPRGYLPSMAQIGLATRQVEREMSAESQSSAADIIQRRLDELSDADKERCIWGDCGILADQLMKALQQAGHTDAVYEIGLAYIHPFEDYESKDFIGGHVVVTVDGESYDAYGAGAKERWVEGPVIQDILAESGFIELGPLLSAHLTVNWITSTWDEIRESRSNLFSGQDVSAALDNWTLGKGAETEYKKKRQKPTPEPGVEGGTDLKPSRLKPPMKVKDSNVYSVQKHRAEKRGSHRDIRIGLDGTLLSFVPVGRGFGKSRLPKKIGEGISVIRTEDHPFDYWWFEGEIPKDSYGAGPVSLETYGTRRIIEWKPDEKLKVEFIGGKYAGTYTFERSKKSKDGKVWWMRKSRPVPEDKTDKKTKKAEEKWYGPPALEEVMNEDVRDQYGYSMFSKAFSEWSDKFLAGDLFEFDAIVEELDAQGSVVGSGFTLEDAIEKFAARYIEDLLISATYYRGRIKLYRSIQLVNPEDFDPTEVGQSWTPIKRAAKPYFGFQKYYSRNLDRIYPRTSDSETYVLTALVPVESVDWYTTLMRALVWGTSDEKEIVLKRGAPIELVDVPLDLSFAIDGTPEALIRASEEIERFVDEKGRTWELRRPGGWVWVESEQARETFVNAFEEWSEKFLAGELPLVAGGWGLYHNRNQAEPTFNLDFERMISDARDLDYVPHLRVGDVELSTYVQNAIQYVENLLMKSQYAQGKLKLYRGIDLVNPEDFDPINVGQSWTPVRAAAQSYFGHKKIRSRNLGFIYDNVDESKFKSYVLTALVPVDSIDWYTTVLRALAFSHLEDFDEKEIVLKRGAPIELIDVPFDLSFAIDGTPEVLIRAADTGKKSKTYFDDYDLYSDANPNDTIRIKYDTVENTRKTITKLESLRKKKTYSHARIVQVTNVMVQRLRVIYDNTGRGKTRYDLAKQYFEKLKGITAKKKTKKSEQDDGGKSEFERKYIAKVREYEQSEEWYDAVREMENMGDETFYYELEGRLESLFPDLELPLSQKDYEELTLANPELITEERSIARSISDDMLDRVYAMLFARQGTYWNYMVSWSKEHEAEYRDGKILLYREITMNNPAELDTARAGIFWTPVLQAAEAHWGGTGEHFLLRALVDFEDINWKSSWYANLIHPEECEIRLRQGAKIELLPLTRPPSRYGRNRQVGEYVYPEEIVFEIEAPSPNLLAVEQGTETELLEAIKDLPEEYQRLIGIYPVESQPTRTGFASEQDEVVLYHGTATANVESILQEGLRPDYGWAIDSFQKGVFLATHPSSAAPWARWSAMRALAPDSQIASEGETSKFYQLMARLRMEEADAVTILEVRIPKNSYQYLYCDYADLVDSGIELNYEREARSNEDYDWTFADDEELVKSWEECLRNGINLVYEGRIPPEWISVLPWQSDWKSNYWFERITDMISERGEDYFDAEQIFDYVPPQEIVEWGFLQSSNRTAHPEGYVAQRYKNWSAPITGELLDSFLENSLYHGTTEKAWELTQQKGYFTPREPFESQAKTGQSSLEGKNLIRQIGTYVTPVAGHAWQYAVGDWGPGSSKDRPSGGASLVLKINPDLVRDLPWFIDLRDRAPSFFTTGRIPVEAVERVIEIPAEWPQRGLTSEPFSWYEHPMMPLINEDFGDPNPSYLKENSKDLKTWRFWQEAIFEPGFLEQQSFEAKQRRVEEFTGRPYETVEPCSCPDDKTYASSDEVGKVWVVHPRTYGRTVPEGEHIVRLQASYPGYDQEQKFQKEWWEEFNRQLEEFYVTQMGLTPVEFRLLRLMAEEDESVAAFIRSENMGEPYKFNLWTRWWPKPRTSAETTRPYKDYPLEDLFDVTGDWKNRSQELGIRMTNLLQERQWASEDIDLTVGEAFDTTLAEIRADVEAVQPRSKDLSEVTLEDYEKTKQVYQRFMIPAGITGDIIRDEWWYESEPIYLWSDMFTLPAGAEEEWQQKIDAQKTETESNIFASNEINYAFYWFAVMQINSIYNMLLSRLGEREMYTGVYAGPPVELPDIIESQRDETEVEIYRWLATSKDEQPVRRLRNRMRPVDLNYYGGYGDVDRIPTGTAGGTVVSVRKGLEALSYGPCWSLSPDAYTRTDQWRLAQEDVVLKEREVRLSPFEKAWRMPTEEEIDVRTYVIEKSIPASALDWYSTLISCALWGDSPEYEVIPKRGVFLSEEVEA